MKIVDHIGIHDNALSSALCENIMDWFDSKKDVWDHQNEWDYKLGNVRNDFTISNPSKRFGSFKRPYHNQLKISLDDGYKKYKNLYYYLPIKYNIDNYKIQKTFPGGGFCGWHYEYGYKSKDAARRYLAWMIYLNDVEKGGKTEFISGIKMTPKQGQLLIWPAYYTHLHRATPDLNEVKYTLTGWFEYID